MLIFSTLKKWKNDRNRFLLFATLHIFFGEGPKGIDVHLNFSWPIRIKLLVSVDQSEKEVVAAHLKRESLKPHLGLQQ